MPKRQKGSSHHKPISNKQKRAILMAKRMEKTWRNMSQEEMARRKKALADENKKRQDAKSKNRWQDQQNKKR